MSGCINGIYVTFGTIPNFSPHTCYTQLTATHSNTDRQEYLQGSPLAENPRLKVYVEATETEEIAAEFVSVAREALSQVRKSLKAQILGSSASFEKFDIPQHACIFHIPH